MCASSPTRCSTVQAVIAISTALTSGKLQNYYCENSLDESDVLLRHFRLRLTRA